MFSKKERLFVALVGDGLRGEDRLRGEFSESYQHKLRSVVRKKVVRAVNDMELFLRATKLDPSLTPTPWRGIFDPEAYTEDKLKARISRQVERLGEASTDLTKAVKRFQHRLDNTPRLWIPREKMKKISGELRKVKGKLKKV